MAQKKLAKNRIKKEISKIVQKIKSLDANLEKEQKNSEAKNEKEIESQNLQTNSAVNLELEKEAEFVAPVINSANERQEPRQRQELTEIERTALDAPTMPVNESANQAYAGVNNSYAAGAGDYISNQNYRSGNENSLNREFRSELNRPGLDRPMFHPTIQERPNQDSGFFSPERARESQAREDQPRMMTQYELKPEEAHHHGIRGRKTEIS